LSQASLFREKAFGKAERVGVVQRGEETVAGRPYCSLSVLKGGLEERWGQIF